MPLLTTHSPYDQCLCELRLAPSHAHFDWFFFQIIYCGVDCFHGIVRFRSVNLCLPVSQRPFFNSSLYQNLQFFSGSLDLWGDYRTDIAKQFFRGAGFLNRFFYNYPLWRADDLKIHSFGLGLLHKVCAARSGQFQSFTFFTQSECVNCSVVLFSQGILSLFS